VVGPRNGCAGGGLPRGSRSHEDGSSKEERETDLQQISGRKSRPCRSMWV
jgi:hypothetical protein